MRNSDPQSEYDFLIRQLDDLQYYRKNLRRGPSFNMWEQDFSGKVKFRDFELEEEQLMEKEVDLRVRIEELRRMQRGLNDQRLNPASGHRLDELYPTMPAPGAMLRFDASNKAEGRWNHVKPDGTEEPGYRNLPQGVKPPVGASTGTLVFPAVMVHPDAISTLLPCEPVAIGGHTPYVKIMVNSVRRTSEVLWAPVNDLVLV